ncbi:hypothetical protein AJ80_04592 [Polytolypa hystricis UAMH7299]|uniref:Sedlin n=1 Tax=Polytolypa hystricis (strain UAMH7299) TaxID=1447883 RepID=A0A2B7YA87_POLH7|nr:hypothetical protein AJ80_04592 [Polytolypa hystricis UAMH7299]
MSSPSIACIAVVGKLNTPLHVSVFPPHLDVTLEFTRLLNSCLDIFEIRRKHKSVEQDMGLLHAFEERLSAYGWLSNTDSKFVIIVDMEGQQIPDNPGRNRASLVGLRDSDLKPAFRALQSAYVKLLQNPFYNPDDDAPIAKTTMNSSGNLSTANNQFINEVKRIGKIWTPGITNI